MDKCEVCGAQVHELRRGRCWGCYNRWAEARPVGFGAACRICSERRSGHLRSVELLGAWTPVCHNCAARVAALDPMPRTLTGLRDALRRERRHAERRATASDRGVSFDRRSSERRASARHASGTGTGTSAAPSVHSMCFHESAPLVDDDMIIEIAELASELESLADELGEVADLTRIHDLNR